MPTATSVLEAFGSNLPGLTQLLTAVAYLLGMWFGASTGILLWKRQRLDPNATLGSILWRGVLCAVFLCLPTAIATSQETLFASATLLRYSPGSVVSAQGRVALDVVLRFVQVVGLWAFLWGFLLLRRANASGYDPGLGHKGIVHVVGGALCLNIVATLQGLAQSFGLETLLRYIVVPG